MVLGIKKEDKEQQGTAWEQNIKLVSDYGTLFSDADKKVSEKFHLGPEELISPEGRLWVFTNPTRLSLDSTLYVGVKEENLFFQIPVLAANVDDFKMKIEGRINYYDEEPVQFTKPLTLDEWAHREYSMSFEPTHKHVAFAILPEGIDKERDLYFRVNNQMRENVNSGEFTPGVELTTLLNGLILDNRYEGESYEPKLKSKLSGASRSLIVEDVYDPQDSMVGKVTLLSAYQTTKVKLENEPVEHEPVTQELAVNQIYFISQDKMNDDIESILNQAENSLKNYK